MITSADQPVSGSSDTPLFELVGGVMVPVDPGAQVDCDSCQ
jgi:hypothetical protein